jgi:hypothetical protein
VVGLDESNLFERFGRRPKARSVMLFGQTMLDTGDRAMLTSIAAAMIPGFYGVPLAYVLAGRWEAVLPRRAGRR